MEEFKEGDRVKIFCIADNPEGYLLGLITLDDKDELCIKPDKHKQERWNLDVFKLEKEEISLAVELEAIQALMDTELEDYGYSFTFNDLEEAEDYGYFTGRPDQERPGFTSINIRVKKLNDSDYSASEFEVELGEDSWYSIEHFEWTIKYLWMAMLWKS